MVFAHAQCFRIASLRARQNIEKRGVGPSTIVPGHSNIGPGATQNAKKTTNMDKKRPTNAQEAAKSEKKGPKSEKCANIVHTRPQLGEVSTRILEGRASPKEGKAVC